MPQDLQSALCTEPCSTRLLKPPRLFPAGMTPMRLAYHHTSIILHTRQQTVQLQSQYHFLSRRQDCHYLPTQTTHSPISS